MRRRLNYANVTATVAVFFAISGGGAGGQAFGAAGAAGKKERQAKRVNPGR